ncbi:hypothetical protein K438DRAFT_1200187 [Mycena galopus ATCC 62051]|nr:hypothetical protein K438DRAFT_1200187 [Mycena galopus ATCC 62051]
MPAVNTAVVRKGKRDARKHTSLAGRTISSSPRATASLNTSASISAPVKLEPTSATIPTSPTIRIPARAPSNTWRHRDELEFILATGEQWDDMSIVQFLRTNVLSVLPAPASTGERWIRVRCTDNSEVTLPRGYRIPLLWVLKFLWSSVAIVLHANEWNERKFDLLHVARLCATLVSGARAAAAIDNGKGGIDRSWRCAAFDRALRRYWNKWLVMRDDFVRDFWNEFGEEEFEEDVLRLGWGSWVLKGEKGFFLTKAEVANGITADEFMRGFVVDEEKKTFAWVEDSSNPSTTVEPAMSSPVEVPVLAVTSQIQTTTVSEQSKAPLSKSPPTPAAQLQPPPKTSLAAVQVGPPRKSPPVRVRSTKSGKQTGSVSLAELVSRIPLGGGRHRSHHQVETLAGRTRRMSEIANIENGEISPPGTQKIARKSSSAMSAPAEVVPTIAIPSLLQVRARYAYSHHEPAN